MAMDPSAAAVRDRYVALFRKYAEICAQFPPLGLNAGNGFVRETIIDDATIRDLKKPEGVDDFIPNVPPDILAERLFRNFKSTHFLLLRSFKDNPNLNSSILVAPIPIMEATLQGVK